MTPPRGRKPAAAGTPGPEQPESSVGESEGVDTTVQAPGAAGDVSPVPTEGADAGTSDERAEAEPFAAQAGAAPADEAQPVDVAGDHPTLDDTQVIELPTAAETAGSPEAAVTSSPEERLAALERENAALRAELATAPAATSAPPAPAPRKQRARRLIAVALVAIGALLAPLGLVAHWADRTLTNTDRYLETVAPLAEKPEIKSAIINRTTTAVMANIDVSSVTTQLEDFLVTQGAPPRLTDAIPLLDQPLTNGVQTVVTRVVTRFVNSDAFNSLWLQVNRISHEQIVGVLEGDPDIALQLDDDGNLTLQLGPIIDVVKQQLVDAGIGVASAIPDINPSVPIAQADSLQQLRTGYQLLNAVGTWLPWVALLFLAAGVIVAPRRARMAVGAGIALVAGMLLLALGLAIGRNALIGALPPGASGSAATVLFNDIVRFMRISLRAVAVVGLFVAIIAFLAGGSAAALATRRSASSGAGALRSWGQGRGVQTGAFGVWLGARLTPIRWVVAAVAVLIIVLADTPTAALVIWTALIALAVIGILQLLSIPPGQAQQAVEPTEPEHVTAS